jgi:molybdopterin/thiamine biosynthesis adenylyltransferase
MPPESRYQRQIALPQIRDQGQQRLRQARVLILGCGALGTVIAETLTRAGVGFLRIVDRDFVEWSNLQRQVLFTEADAEIPTPKAIAAAKRLQGINREVTLDPVVAHVDSRNLPALAEDIDLILDGCDNFSLRYLVNDFAVSKSHPWIYGACLATEGRVMSIVPGQTPCLRCLFPEQPSVGEHETCDTAGILGSAVNVVASLQCSATLRLLVGEAPQSNMLTFDVWRMRFRTLDLSKARQPDCPCCGLRDFPFLSGKPDLQATALCGRNAVQVLSHADHEIDLANLANRLQAIGNIQQTPFLIRAFIDGHELTLFRDGRAIIKGTEDEAHARALYDRYVGS